jgi:hypothetical protein
VQAQPDAAELWMMLMEDSDGFYPQRTSIDNAPSLSTVETVTEFMQNFRRQHPASIKFDS